MQTFKRKSYYEGKAVHFHEYSEHVPNYMRALVFAVAIWQNMKYNNNGVLQTK
jgi:23S rRNA (uracil1939-C5)-methyltransferase